MSGFKRALISLTEEEYQNLHQAEIQLRSVDRDLERILNQNNRQHQKQMDHHFNELNKRQKEYQNVLSGFSDQIQALTNDTGRLFSEQQSQFYQSMNYVAQDIFNNTTEVLTQETYRLEDQIQKIAEQQENEILTIREFMDGQDIYATHKLDQVEEWRFASNKIRQHLLQNYDMDYFFPEEMDHINNDLEMADRNVNANMFDAALKGYQEKFLHLIRLQMDVERKKAEIDFLLDSADQISDALYKLAIEYHSIQAMDMQGNLLDIWIDVDFWTNGGLSPIIQNLEEIKTQISDPHFQITKDELQIIIDEALPNIKETLENLLAQARRAVINSQIRVNLAEIVIEALKDQGFALEDSQYVHGDMREGFVAEVSRVDGSDIVISIVPNDDLNERNRLYLRSMDEEIKSEHELRQRAKEIYRTLQNYGLAVGSISETSIADDWQIQSVQMDGLLKPLKNANG